MSAAEAEPNTPQGEIALRLVPQPSDLNHSGKVHGGWVLYNMDVAGGLYARLLTRQRVTTVAVEGMTFLKPIDVGDEVTFYTRTGRIGRTSLAVIIEIWVRKPNEQKGLVQVTSGTFIFVAVSQDGRPVPLTINLA